MPFLEKLTQRNVPINVIDPLPSQHSCIAVVIFKFASQLSGTFILRNTVAGDAAILTFLVSIHGS